jgi:hypothetical protein
MTVIGPSDATNSTNSFAATGLGFAVENGHYYAVRGWLMLNTASGIAGMLFRFQQASGTPTNVQVNMTGTTTNATTTSLSVLGNGTISNAYNTVAATDGFAVIIGVWDWDTVTEGTPTTVSLDFKSGTNGIQAKVYAGSYLEVTQLT